MSSILIRLSQNLSPEFMIHISHVLLLRMNLFHLKLTLRASLNEYDAYLISILSKVIFQDAFYPFSLFLWKPIHYVSRHKDSEYLAPRKKNVIFCLPLLGFFTKSFLALSKTCLWIYHYIRKQAEACVLNIDNK